MKKSAVALGLLTILFLSSCRPLQDFFSYHGDPYQDSSSSVVPPEKSVNLAILNVIGANKEYNKNIKYVASYNDIFLRRINVMFYDDEHLVPYLNLLDYFTLINSIATSHKGTIEQNEKGFIFTARKLTIPIFKVEDIYQDNQFYIYGDYSSYMMSSNVANDSSLSLGYKDADTNEYGGDGFRGKRCSYQDAGYLIHEENGVRYYPLSLLNVAFSDFLDVEFFYNYEDIYIFDDYDYFTETFSYKYNGRTIKPYVSFYNSAYNEKNTMSEAVKKDRLASYIFLFQNFFGLKNTWEFDDEKMNELFDSVNFKNGLLSDNPLTRRKAIVDFNNILDDGHTAISASPWEKGRTYTGTKGKRYQAMREAKTTITEVRKQANLNDINYSKDGSTALVVLDSFNNIDTDYKNKTVAQLAKKDDYFYLANLLSTIESKGGVKNVIIDISTNGGGYVALLFKILGLLSPDNNKQLAGCSFYVESYDTYETDTVYVDSNLDGKYDEKDVFGDNFNFYIMSSNYSYSCANAFSFLAQHYKFATIIGDRSGGGECTIQFTIMPTGEEVYHSANLHIGHYTIKDGWIGDESGAYVEDKYHIDNNEPKHYDMEFLQALIAK